MRRLPAIGLLLLAAACGSGAGWKRPNVLLYVVDTLRADEIGAYGQKIVQTPSFDALAAEGVLFERTYAPSSWTRASLSTVLTGLDPRHHGVRGRTGVLPPQIETLAEGFRRAGYATGAIVANPNIGSAFGFDQGWDQYVELYARRGPGRVGSGELVASSEVVTDHAIEWIDGAREPFFLFVLAIDPHWPYDPPARFDRYGGSYDGPVRNGGRDALAPNLSHADRERVRSFYHGEVAANDAAFGRLLRHLRDRGLDGQTIVAFTADHGEEFWEHGQAFHGKTLFEECVRVPLVVRQPGRIPAGLRVRTPVGLVDLPPTLLAAAGLPVPADLDGRPLPLDEADIEQRPIHASLALDGHDVDMLLMSHWKLLVDPVRHRRLLLDLDRDPHELHDFAPAEAARTTEMQRRLDAHVAAAETRHTRLVGSAGTPAPVVPEATRRALEALGYLRDTAGP